MEITTRPKKWGNSFGIIIPNSFIKKEKITSDTEIIVRFKKENPIKEIFGSLKNLKTDFQKFRDKERKEEWLREEKEWKQHTS